MKNKGITLTSLIITIVVLIILAGITITIGKNIIEKANLESLKTNMLLIQAEVKASLEEYIFTKDEATLIGTKIEDKDTKIIQKLNKAGINNIENWYYLDDTNFKEMNLSDVKPNKGEYFLIKYDKESLEVEVLHTTGYTKNGQTKYTLTDLKNVE